MERQDAGLPFMLQYEHVAWYEKGTVTILDRRIYPAKIQFVSCKTHTEVAQALKDMVTQSAGPYTAAGMGMTLAAYEVRNKSATEQLIYLEKAAYTLSHARPTTANRMEQITRACLTEAQKAIETGENAVQVIFEHTLQSLNRRYTIMNQVADHLMTIIPNGAKIMTQCFGETIIGMMLRQLKEHNKTASFYCCETRPYYQGARLTATCCSQLGFTTTVITDNMAAYIMKEVGIDLLTSAADTITRTGTIANKIGTYQLALLADIFKIPYYVTGIPDADKQNASDIIIEMRSPELILGNHTERGVKALYPSFDITPPELIQGVITDKGIYMAQDVEHYFDTPVQRFY